jgi:hypothetical protein
MEILEQRLMKITHDLCEAHRSAAGLPASSALPFRSALAPGDRVFPNVLFHAEQLEMSQNRNKAKVKVEMVTQCQHDDTDETVQSDWTRRLRGIVNDRAKWSAFLAALPEADRTGFQILRFVVDNGGITIDAETKLRSFNTTLQFHLITDEFLAS